MSRIICSIVAAGAMYIAMNFFIASLLRSGADGIVKPQLVAVL
jgi:hypothetical protein